MTQGAEIPTIVNGKISVKNKIKTRKFNIVKTQNSEKSVRVRINGDSHLRGMATKLKQYLNAKHQVSSIIKSGAKIKQIVSTQDSDRKLLGRRDYLIISAGSNDINSNTTINEVIAPLLEFVNQNDHTNVIILNIPSRYDLWNELPSKGINKTIYRCNNKLSKLLKPYPHVQILETTTERAHYTKFGSHFNNMGKDWVAKQICEFIGTSVFTSNKSEIALPLQWTNAI